MWRGSGDGDGGSGGDNKVYAAAVVPDPFKNPDEYAIALLLMFIVEEEMCFSQSALHLNFEN